MKELFIALSKFQSEVKNPEKSNKGVHGGTYAPIENVWEVARALLGKYGLSVSHFPVSTYIEGKYHIGLKSYLGHSSGESICNEFYFPVAVADPQKIGAAFTYLKRQHATAILGITPEDEDLDADNIDTVAVKKAHAMVSDKPNLKKVPGTNNSTYVNNVVTGNDEITFGPHKGKKFDELTPEQLSGAIEWARKNNKFMHIVDHYDNNYLKNKNSKASRLTVEDIPF